MSKFYQRCIVITGLLMIILLGTSPIKAGKAFRPEVRALWVDAFNNGAKTPEQIDQLVQDALTANINTLIVQVRRRGDAYYNKSIEPRTEDPDLQPGLDVLQYLIEKAHANQIEVHAWLNTLVAWNKPVPHQDPNHVWNLHGPQAAGRANWVSYYRNFDKSTARWSDKLNSSFFLDPGHPDVVDYTVDVYLNIIKNYDVDGIHLDYTRYAGMGWGYNATSVSRFNRQHGTTGMPAPDDPKWAEWRRQQTANLVRKVYLKAIALKPEIKVSSAVITWGDGPVAETDWEKSMAYKEVFQDWRSWLAEGIIDVVLPMNYFNDFNHIQQNRFNQWIEWEKNHQYGRQIVIGPGIFSQYIEDSLDQIRRAQTASSQGNYAAGVALYAYGASNFYSNIDYKEAKASQGLPRQPHSYLPETHPWIYNLLAREGGYHDPVLKTYIPTQPVFPAPAPIPEMPWKTAPTKGFLMGTVVDVNGNSLDHLKIVIEGLETPASQGITPTNVINRHEVYTDGRGWFGLAELPPGNYRVTVDDEMFKGEKIREVVIRPGRVEEANFSETSPPQPLPENSPQKDPLK